MLELFNTFNTLYFCGKCNATILKFGVCQIFLIIIYYFNYLLKLKNNVILLIQAGHTKNGFKACFGLDQWRIKWIA